MRQRVSREKNCLAKYESLSDHIEVVKKDPDVYPTFAEKYTSETSFDGEGAITSAIDYVVSDDHPQLYILQSHGEGDLPETFSAHIKKENIETNTFSLLNEDSVPEDADCVLIYAPTSDISDEKEKILSDYTKNGGKLMVVAGPVESGSLTNLYSLLEEYNIDTQEGVVVEGDRDCYAFQAPYMLMPDMNSNDITDPLIDDKYYVLMPVSQGMKVNDTTGAVTTLLTTSDSAYSNLMAAGIDDLRHQQLVWADPSIITGMDITVDGETVALVDRSSVVDLIEAVNSIVLKNEEEK